MNNVKITVSNHAYMRMKERLGYNKKTADRMAVKAVENGIDGSINYGQLERYMYKIEKYDNKNAVVHLYGENVYIFARYKHEMVLVTVFSVPNELKNQVRGAQKKRKAA